MNFFSLIKRNILFKLKRKKNIDTDIHEENLELEKLFKFYNTDKAEYYKQPHEIKSDKYTEGHGYSKFYVKHFSKLRDKSINLLEIGSYYGSSAAAFTKFFPNAKIFCLDINLRNFKYKSKNIYPFGLDATNPKMVKKFLDSINFNNNSFFDIIIDDGSHLLSHQLKSLDIFYKLVSPGGYYIIEDYKFCEFFDHLKDTEDPPLSKIIDSIKNNKIPKVKLVNEEMLKILSQKKDNIFEYKGNQKFSHIVFFKK